MGARPGVAAGAMTPPGSWHLKATKINQITTRARQIFAMITLWHCEIGEPSTIGGMQLTIDIHQR